MNTLNEIVIPLKKHVNVIDSILLGEMNGIISDLHNNLRAVSDKDRNLRIAVIGQMKSGKSSFLNAAFFGRDLLPKAETPMTAALTKIVYSPENKAEVVFYTIEDWQAIEARARDYARIYESEKQKILNERKGGIFSKPQEPRPEEIRQRIPDALKASLELVEKAKERGLNVQEYLGKTHQISNSSNAEELAKDLHEYVGSGGKYTAITKMSVLYVNDPRLEGLEIIDTPGFNDPVVSRGQATRTFLGQCDVIFLLSALSQFLTSTDMSVLREQLSEAGIDEKAVFLVGSQLDLALRQDRDIIRKADTLANTKPIEVRAQAKVGAMIAILEEQMTTYAFRALDDQINAPNQDEKTKRILSAVKTTRPRFVSGWCWLVAENFAHLSPDDLDQIQHLNNATGFGFDETSLRALSKIPALRDEVLKQKEHKKALLSSKEHALIKGSVDGVRDRLEKIQEELTNRQDKIQHSNIKELAILEDKIVKQLNSGRAKLEDVFDEEVAKIQTKFAYLRTEVQGESSRFRTIRTGTETSTEEYEISTSKWFNPFSWGDTETKYRTVVSEYAHAQDAIENVNNYALGTTKKLQSAIENCVDLDYFRQKIERAAIGLFDLSDENFDSEYLLREVNKSIRKIKIPNTNFGKQDYSAFIISQFGSDRVWGGNVGALKQAQHEVIGKIVADLQKEVDAKTDSISKMFEKTGKHFIEDMTKDIRSNLAQLRADIENKAQSLSDIAAAMTCITDTMPQLDAITNLPS